MRKEKHFFLCYFPAVLHPSSFSCSAALCTRSIHSKFSMVYVYVIVRIVCRLTLDAMMLALSLSIRCSVVHRNRMLFMCVNTVGHVFTTIARVDKDSSQWINIKMYNEKEWSAAIHAAEHTTFSFHKRIWRQRYHNFSALARSLALFLRVTFVLCAQLETLLPPD